MSTFNSSRIKRIFAQQQTTFAQFNNTSGTWSNTGAVLQRADQGSLTLARSAPYSRFPVLTGTPSEVAGIRGRKSASWDIRGLPLIPSGTAGTVPNSDVFFQCAFGQAATIVASTSATYNFTAGTAVLPFSLFEFQHGSTSLTSRAAWGCVVQRVVYNFNGPFITADLQGQAGYLIDNVGFSVFDPQAQAGLTAYPIEPTSPTVSGTPIAGFGNGYTATIATQSLSLKIKALSITHETGLFLQGDVYGSPYPIAPIQGTRRVSLAFTSIDDDSSALNAIKVAADTDNTTITATIQAGTVAGSIITWTLNNIQLNAFDQRDNGEMVDSDIPQSYAHATNIGSVDDAIVSFT